MVSHRRCRARAAQSKLVIWCTINVLAQCMSVTAFVCDIRLSPEVLMKRPVKDEGGKWRLDMILKRRAVSS